MAMNKSTLARPQLYKEILVALLVGCLVGPIFGWLGGMLATIIASVIVNESGNNVQGMRTERVCWWIDWNSVGPAGRTSGQSVSQVVVSPHPQVLETSLGGRSVGRNLRLDLWLYRAALHGILPWERPFMWDFIPCFVGGVVGAITVLAKTQMALTCWPKTDRRAAQSCRSIPKTENVLTARQE
jgi:hypothetical protein